MTVDPLPYVWFGILGATLLLFLLLDGADLGIGALSLFIRDEARRSVMISAIGPMWYANETWLVISGAVLFGAFPAAYGILLSALYVPCVVLLFGLILRAVSIEFREHSARKGLWGTTFGVGSLLAILAQGFILGGLMGGIRVENGGFVGGPWDWLDLPAFLLSAGIVFGYVMLGSAYLAARTEGANMEKSRRLLKISATISALMFAAVVLTLPLASPTISRIWLEMPRPLISSLFFAGALAGFLLILFARKRLYAWCVMAFACAACSAVAGIFPYLVPLSVTIADAAAPRQTLLFMLAGIGAVIPIVTVYTLYSRGVFRGKVRGSGDGEY
jgi:cytochrome d ubiquinol oxidase subunit II